MLTISHSPMHKKVRIAMALIWKALLVVERYFRKPNVPHLYTTVYDDAA